MRVEICGGIAAGKTTFAMLMHGAGTETVFENFKNNPFWQPFYTNPGKYIFETEVTFLLQHYHDIKRGLEKKNNFICDFSFYIDLAYAQMGLQGNRLKIFENVLEETLLEVKTPSVIVHLACDPHIQYERIMKRGRTEESSITVDFLKTLDDKISENLTLLNNEVKVIKIDSGKKNFVSDDHIKNELIKEVKSSIAVSSE
jgi:deoxyguanosine kinase